MDGWMDGWMELVYVGYQPHEVCHVTVWCIDSSES